MDYKRGNPMPSVRSKSSNEEKLDFREDGERQLLRNSSDDHASSSVEQLDNDDDLNVNISYIDPRTIRWMNRRRQNAVTQTNNRVSPIRSKQLREIYHGFEVNEHGDVGLPQLKEALLYVESKSKHSNSAWTDNRQIPKLFRSIDSNHNGTIDFPEFLTAMTADYSQNQSGGDGEAFNEQQTFFEFATRHRRQRILDKLSNPDIDDTKRYRQFTKLFDVKFFREDLNDLDDSRNVIVDHKLTTKQKNSRNNEVFRSREASFALTSEKESGYIKSPIIQPTRPYTITSSDKLSKTTTTEIILPRKVKVKLQRKLAKFSIPHSTFVPETKSVKDSLKLKLKVSSEASGLMRQTISIPAMPPKFE